MSTVAKQFEGAEAPASQARYGDPENFFNFSWPPVPRRQFVAERDRAFAADTPTGEVLLDSSEALATPYPATSPLLLARYLRIRAGQRLETLRRASAEIHYVLRGAGVSHGHGADIAWGPGDVFCLPGGAEVVHEAGEDAVLFTVCNEPLLRFEALEPPRPGAARVGPVHWPKHEIDSHFEAIIAREDSAEASGRALQLTSAAMAPASQPVPSMNLAINTLEPGKDQRPHRHNGVAITLAVQGEGVHSMIEDERIDWSTGAVQVTPATELHSHHNRGPHRMVALIVQDEGLHFYTRTPGFSWT